MSQEGGVESHRDDEREGEELEEIAARQHGGRLSTGTRLQRENRGREQGGDWCRVRKKEGAGRERWRRALEFGSFSFLPSCKVNT